ncbi:MAG: choice-of-anchor D domain-containing protein [Deltaproteobacteria bacterium]|nr:choice-of-anchor D domain-containing protein [Deltaproteobacteria bacterium]
MTVSARRFRVLASALLALAGSLAGCDCGEEELQRQFAELQVTPADVDFQDVLVGELRARPVTVSNAGNTPLRITGFVLEGGTEIALAGVAPQSLAAGGSAQLAFAYQPTDEGRDEATLTVEADDGAGPKIVHLRGRGIRPGLEVLGDQPGCGGSGPSISFGTVAVGESTPRGVSIRANGSATVEVTSVSIVGPPAYSVDPFSGTIQAGATAELTVRFFPTAAGPATAELRIESSAGPVVVPLCGRGAGPALCGRPVPLDFGSVPPGITRTATLTLESCGDLPLELTSVELSSDPTHPTDPGFSMASLATRSLPPGATLPVAVHFRSTTLGRKDGFLIATSNALGAPASFFGLIARVAPPCDLLVTPDRLSFPGVTGGSSSTKSVLVANQGSDACQITGAQIVGPTTFSLPTAVAATRLGPGEASVIAVRYSPTATSAATEQGTLRVLELGGTHDVDLLGNSTEPSGCALDIDPTVVPFGAHAIGTTDRRTVRLRNLGDALCRLSGVRLAAGSPHFSATAPTLPLVLPGLGGSIDVEYHPISGGAHVDTVLVSVTAGGNTETLSIALSGTGADARLCVTPAELLFGEVARGQTKDLSFRVESCGSVDVVLRGLQMPPATRRNFSIAGGPSVPSTLASGSFADVTVRYSPSSAGPHFGHVKLSSSDLSNPSVRLVGGTPPTCDAILDCAPAELRFGTTEVGQQKPIRIVCTNAGVLPVTLSNAIVAGTNELSVGFTPALIQPGESIALEVIYLPADVGPDSGSLVITSDACFGPSSIPVSGEGFETTLPPCIPPSTFSPVVDWSWTGSTFEPASRNVWMTPMVANLTDDDLDGRIDENDIPEVVFTTFDAIPATSANGSQPGVLRIVSGDDGREILSLDQPRFAESAQLAIGDLDGDGEVEIVGSKWIQTPPGGPGLFGMYTTGTLIAINAQGRVLWESEPWSWPDQILWNASAPALADLDGDGFSEVVFGREVFDHTGKLLWRGAASMAATAGGPHSVVADLDLDGRPEVLAGDTAYRHDGTVLWQAMEGGRPLGDGGTSIGWLDPLDTHPSVVFDTGNTIHAVDWTGQVIWSMSPNSRGPTSTLPVLADFDGDGADEVAVADGKFVHVYDGDGDELWSAVAQDETCCPGVSAFDFEGDGAYELLLNDYGHVYVFRGATGQQIFIAPRPNQTNYEVPVVADVDKDGHAEIIVANDGGSVFGGGTGGGVTVYSNTGDNWVSAPPIWNQQAFHGGNVHPSGAIPRQPPRLVGPGTVFRGSRPACEH